MLKPLQTLVAPHPSQIPEDFHEFLVGLGGPSWIECPGPSSRPARVVVSLLHANELSGARAIHGWLRSGRPAAAPTFLVVASVGTYLTPPCGSRRLLLGNPDANRCFRPPFVGSIAENARELLRRLERLRPQALVDLHNNTGRNPPYGVGCGATAAHLGLTRLFADRFMDSDLRLGALFEATTAWFPTVTIECGKVGDPLADAVALAGLGRFLSAGELDFESVDPQVQVLARPTRVQLKPGLRLAFAPAADAAADLTLLAGVDRYNFGRVDEATLLGWCSGPELPLVAIDAAGRDIAADLFHLEGGALWTSRSLVPIMMTQDPIVAAADCLFYAMLGVRGSPRDGSSAGQAAR